jgi:hypothetical protein
MLLTKFPKIYHLPWSRNSDESDRIMEDTSYFDGRKIVVTVKLDGENTNIYRTATHARSVDTAPHITRDWVRAWAAGFQWKLPEGWRICGENLWAKHSIHYQNLESYFYGYMVFDDDNKCLSWNDTKEFFKEWNITPVPVVYSGVWDIEAVKKLTNMRNHNKDEMEGYVVRLADSFDFDDFSRSVAKYVRKNHIQTDDHWLYDIGNIVKK